MITEDPTLNQNTGDGEVDSTSGGSDTGMLVLGGVAALMLTLIFVAMISKQIAGRKSAKRRAEERMVNMAMEDEELRRQEWIDYYVGQETWKKLENWA